MKRLFIFLLCVLASTSMIVGSDYFMATDMGSSARMIRLGNVEGFDHLSNSVFENPAGLYRVRKAAVSVFRTTFMDEVEYQNVSFCSRIPGGNGVIGFGYMTAGVTGLSKTDLEKQYMGSGDGSNVENRIAIDERIISIGSFNYLNRMAKVTYQVSQNDNIHFGASAVYYATDMADYTGRGYNIDAGVIFEGNPISLSLFARNIASNAEVEYENSSISTYNATETLPKQIVGAVEFDLGHLKLYSQLKTVNNHMLFSVAANYQSSMVPFLNFSCGYKQFPVLNEVKGNWTMGLGIDLLGVNFDYAYEQSEHILYNHKHYFSLGIAF